MMSNVRLAILGAGSMGRKHAELVAASDACSLVGLCDAAACGREVADHLGVPFYQDAEELLERERPDGAIIATPNAAHVAGAEACAEHSVHALIEKPIADTPEAAQHIVQATEDGGSRVLVGHHRRHSPYIKEARSMVQVGALGRLVGVSALWTLLKPDEYYEVDWRCRRPGGGPVLINLIHELDCLRFICGEIRQVYAQSSAAARGLEVEDSVSITLTFETGALGSVFASDATPSPWSYEATTHENPHYFPVEEDCYHFFGTSGSLAFPSLEFWRYADEGHRGWQHPLKRSRHEVVRADPLVVQLGHFCRVVRGEEEPLIGARDASRSLAAAMAVLESSRSQRPVELANSGG